MARRTKPRPVAGAYTVTRLDQARVLAHPLRLRLLEQFARGPCTTKQAAEALGEPPTRLYHHARALEKVGLIGLKETRPNRGTVEKYFEAVARSFDVDPGLFSRGGRAVARSTVAGLFERAAAETEAAVARASEIPEEFFPGVARIGVGASRRQVAAVRRELIAFVRRLEKMGREETPASRKSGVPETNAALTLAFVPMFPIPEKKRRS